MVACLMSLRASPKGALCSSCTRFIVVLCLLKKKLYLTPAHSSKVTWWRVYFPFPHPHPNTHKWIVKSIIKIIPINDMVKILLPLVQKIECRQGFFHGVIFVWFDYLHPSQHFFSHDRTGLPRLNLISTKPRIKGHNAVSLVRLEPTSQAFYHRATALLLWPWWLIRSRSPKSNNFPNDMSKSPNLIIY